MNALEANAVKAMVKAHNDGYTSNQWTVEEDSYGKGKYKTISMQVSGHAVHLLAASVSMIFCGVSAYAAGMDEIRIS